MTRSITVQPERRVTAEENSSESTAKKRKRKKKKKKKSIANSSPPVNTSLLPTISCLRTMPTYRDNARLSTSKHAPLLVLQHAHVFASQHAPLLALATRLSYIRHEEEMEATGQG